jgi:hypothetical protein
VMRKRNEEEKGLFTCWQQSRLRYWQEPRGSLADERSVPPGG